MSDKRTNTWSSENAHLTIFFQKNLIVFAQSNAKDDGRDVFKAMYPFLPFTPLTTYVKHATAH
jgi:hypothetical protein